MFLARKELWFSKKRFLLIGFIIVLISWLVFMLSGLGNGLSDLGTAAIRYSPMDLAIFEEEAEFTLSKSTLPGAMVDEVSQLDGVTEAAGLNTAIGAVLKGTLADEEAANKKTSVMFIGIEPGSFIEPRLVSGKPLNADEEKQVIVDHSLALEGFAIGDTLTLNGSETEFEIVGMIENQKLNHLPAIYLPLDTLREVKYAVPGSDMGIEEAVSSIFIQVNGLTAEQLTEQIDGIEVGDKKAALNGVPGYSAESGTINLMLWLLVFISAFVVAVFFYVLTTQKTQQFGVMKAIGASNGFVILTVVSQVFLLTSLSILLGIGLTYFTQIILPEGMPFNLLTEHVVLYGLTLLGTSLLGSLFSVSSIIKIDPITALGRAE